MREVAEKIRRCFAKPLRENCQAMIALLRGSYYIIYYNLSSRKVVIKFPFKAYARVSIIGRGSVTIDSGCSVHNNVFRGLTIITLSEKAIVVIGSGCSLGGLTIRSYSKVLIGARTMTALSLIQDVSFVNFSKAKAIIGDWNMLDSRPVSLGENVWLGGISLVLRGSHIGDDCVLAAGTLCQNMECGSYCLISGNPAKRGLPINQVLKLKR